MDIVSVVERISALAEPSIRISANRCLRAVDRHNTCELCAQACPVGALTFQEELHLDESKCQGCAACIQVCPLGVFHGEDGAAELFRCFQVMGRVEVVEIACGSHPDAATGPGGAGIVLQTGRCLATLAPSVLLGLFKMGVKRISLRLDACAACSLGKVCAQIRRSVADTNVLLQAGCSGDSAVEMVTASAPGWTKRPVIDVKNPPMSRRSFFDMLSHSSMRLVGQIVNDPKMPSACEKQPGRERLRLANALRLYPEVFSAAALPRLSKLFPLYNLQVSQDCNACGVCASMCPSGALQLISGEQETNEQINRERNKDFAGDPHKSESSKSKSLGAGHTQFELNFSPLKCMGCGICVEYCEPGALRLQETPELLFENDLEQALQERAVVSGELQRCERCHVYFARKPQSTSQRSMDLCPLCEFRRSQPFGFALPRRAMLKNAV